MTRADTSAYNQPPGNLTLSQLSHLMESLGAMEDDPQLQLVELQADEVLFRQGDEAHSITCRSRAC